MNEATDVSLEADRLEELLEAPVASPPVVMIEYRNRGVPWWLLGPVLVLVPASVGAIFYYQHSVVERYRAKAAKAEYIQKVQAVEQAAATKSVGTEPHAGVGSRGHCGPCGFASRRPGRGRSNGEGSRLHLRRNSAKAVDVELGTAAVGSPTTVALEPPRPRVRSMTRSPFDTDDESPPAQTAPAPSRLPRQKKAPGDASGAKLAATPKDARAGDKVDQPAARRERWHAGTPAIRQARPWLKPPWEIGAAAPARRAVAERRRVPQSTRPKRLPEKSASSPSKNVRTP